MDERFIRTSLVIGEDNIDRLSESRVAVFGVGGVGGFVCEALARSGVGKLTLIDGDTVAKSNINRQIIALQSTVGRHKAEVMKERILDINPNAEVETHNIFLNAETAGTIDFPQFDLHEKRI